MDLLILGGTVFVGRRAAEAALARGHRVTIFHRGRHGPAPAGVEVLTGDRDGGLAPLSGRRWDAVLDTSGYFPRVVRDSARLLAPAVGNYTFISSVSAYRPAGRRLADEDAPLEELADAGVEEITGGTYGGLKVLCEREVQQALPGRALIVRPGLIVGPPDPTDRFTYWPWRAARGGRMLAPGRPERAVQFIDVRDLAEWLVRLAEERVSGVLNATGPAEPIPMGELLAVCRRETAGDAEFEWVSDDFLLAQGVEPYSDLPLWIPNQIQQLLADIGRARAAGLTLRPLAETIRATLEWERSRPPDRRWRAGLRPEREAALLADWDRHQAGGGSLSELRGELPA